MTSKSVSEVIEASLKGVVITVVATLQLDAIFGTDKPQDVTGYDAGKPTPSVVTLDVGSPSSLVMASGISPAMILKR